MPLSKKILKVELIPALKDNYIALLIDESAGTCVAIDPSEAAPVQAVLEAKNLKLHEIWNTHHHWDHVGGNLALKKLYGAKILCSKFDQTRIEGSDYGFIDKEDHSFGGHDFRILAIPGHTLGHIAFYSDSLKLLFAGDTLFSVGCGRLFEGSPEQMFRSLQTLLDLPKETLLYCGHEYTEANIRFALSLEPHNSALQAYHQKISETRSQALPSLPSRLDLERDLNPFLRARSSTEFASLRLKKDSFV